MEIHSSRGRISPDISRCYSSNAHRTVEREQTALGAWEAAGEGGSAQDEQQQGAEGTGSARVRRVWGRGARPVAPWQRGEHETQSVIRPVPSAWRFHSCPTRQAKPLEV